VRSDPQLGEPAELGAQLIGGSAQGADLQEEHPGAGGGNHGHETP
jgi:hypothetical protein